MTDADIVFGVLVSLGADELSMSQLRALCAPFAISDVNLRSVLSRMHGRDAVRIRKEGRRAYYSLGERGRRVGANTSRSFTEPQWADWDGSYWMAAFTFPETRRRYRIQKKLTAYRFRALYGGMWIRPYSTAEGIEEAFTGERAGDPAAERAGRPTSRALASSSDGTFDLAVVRFPDGIGRERIAGMYDLVKVASSLSAAHGAALSSLEELPRMNPESAYRVRMTLGGELVSALASDPLLPPVLLPDDWPGTRLRVTFREWNKVITERAEPFVSVALSAEED